MIEPYTLAASVVASMAVSALVAARVARRPTGHPEAETAHTARCGVCGETGGREAVLDHLESVHNAPGGRSDREALVEYPSAGAD